MVLCYFLVLVGNSYWCYVSKYLVYNTVVRLCQFFCCGEKWFSKWEHISTKKSYWVTLLWSASQCVYFIRPNTLLLYIFLFCIFLLYRTDPQVEVQIRILLKDKYVKSTKCKHQQSHFDFWNNAYWISFFWDTTHSLRYVSHKIRFSILLRFSFLWAQGAPQQLATTSMAPCGAILLVRFELIASRSLC